MDQLGRLDILVNNAGIFAGGPLDETAGPDLDRILAIDVARLLFALPEAEASCWPGNPAGQWLMGADQ